MSNLKSLKPTDKAKAFDLILKAYENYKVDNNKEAFATEAISTIEWCDKWFDQE